MKPKQMDNLVYSLICLFVLLNLFDLLLTIHGVNLGLAKEGNPYLSHYNIRGVTIIDAAFKLAIAITMGAALYLLYQYSKKDDSPIAERLILTTLIIGNSYYIYLVCKNSLILLNII